LHPMCFLTPSNRAGSLRNRNGQRDASCIYDDMGVCCRVFLGQSGWSRFPGPTGAGHAGPINTGTTPVNLVVLAQPLQQGQILDFLCRYRESMS
jgi:hypothetical protein